ncbi:MAG: hypothetical protein HYZ44_16345 [Bacteroidetes bacterium]|nr:hypothetical protein [Bacteroidota bacterium]
MKRKNVLLSLALLLPVLVFVFLKFFGKNKFDIPVFHQERVEVTGDCDLKYEVPYVVPKETLSKLNCVLGEPSIILFSDLVGESKTRLEAEIQKKKLNLIAAGGLLNTEELRKLSCIFVMPSGSNAVLVDGEQRIRGYYELNDRDETDRLIVELKILFNEY